MSYVQVSFNIMDEYEHAGIDSTSRIRKNLHILHEMLLAMSEIYCYKYTSGGDQREGLHMTTVIMYFGRQLLLQLKLRDGF